MSRTMLDYLVRTNLLVPSSSRGKRTKGKKREYSFGDIVILRALKSLLDNGISVSRVSKALHKLGKKHKELKPKDIPGQIKYLVTDGEEVFFKNKKQVLENLSKNGQMAFSFVLDLTPAKDKIIEDISRLNLKKTG